MDLTFNTQSSQLLTLSSPPDKIFFKVYGQNRLVTNFQLSIFVLSREKYNYQSQKRNLRLFFSYFGSFPPVYQILERHFP